MGQRVIIDANNNVRIIETGPIGPPGIGGSDNEIALVTTFVDSNLLPDGYDFAMVATYPNPAPVGVMVAGVNAGSYSGVYEGQTVDSEDPQPLIFRRSLPSKIIFAQMKLNALANDIELGPWLIANAGNGWEPPIKFGGSGARTSGAYVIDLRGETASPYPPSSGFGSDYSGSGGSGIEFGGSGSTIPLQYFGVDFSVLPDDKDVLVVLLRPGQWGLVPTGWPDHSRGGWTLNVAFDTFLPESNMVEMGLTMEELLTWGFFPTNVDVVVDYHTTWGG